MAYNQKLLEKVQTDRFGTITYINSNNETKTITKSDDLIKIEIEDFICNNGNFIGSVIAKKATIELINTSNKYNLGTENLTDKTIEISTGAIIDKGLVTEETVTNSWGEFIINSIDSTSTEDVCTIIAYDKIIYLNKNYVSTVTYPSTILDIFESVCAQCGLTYSSSAFLNSDFVVADDQYEGKTCRQVISDIAKMAMGFVRINGEEVSINTLGTTPVTNTINKNTTYTLNISPVSSPINKLSIGLSVVNGGETSREDSTSIGLNGQNELRLDDIGFLYTSDLRELAIDGMFTAISGLSFLPFNCTYLGYDNIRAGNMITVTDIANNSYNSYIFNHMFTFDGGFEGEITTDILSKSANTYTNTNTNVINIKKAEISINENKDSISSLTSRVVDTETSITSMTQTVDGIFLETQKIVGIQENIATIETSIDGINETLSSKGGSNLLPNSVKQFGNGNYTGSFVNYKDTETEINLLSKSAIEIGNGTDSISIIVPNGEYNYSAKYKKLIGLASCSITVNGIETTLTGDDWSTTNTTFIVSDNTITITYTGDTDYSCWIGDVIVVGGDSPQPWTPNANEIYTDTVKIGEGITITSNTSNTTFKADTTGTKVYNNNDLVNPVSEFTDDGVVTGNVTADKGDMAKLIFKDMGTQTWITRG